MKSIVVLFGGKAAGKTMMLERLSKWLHAQGYNLKQVNTINPIFMLVNVVNKNGEELCQILDAEGSQYFDEHFPLNPLPQILKQEISMANHRVWVFLVEPDVYNVQYRIRYVEKVKHMKNYMTSSDKVIFVCVKADKSRHLLDEVGQPYVVQFFRTIIERYPNIFSQYENHNPITKLCRKYNFDFVVFSAGEFYRTENDTVVYHVGVDKYPADLWKSIRRHL